MLIITMATLLALNKSVLRVKAVEYVGTTKFEVSYQTVLVESRTHSA